MTGSISNPGEKRNEVSPMIISFYLKTISGRKCSEQRNQSRDLTVSPNWGDKDFSVRRPKCWEFAGQRRKFTGLEKRGAMPNRSSRNFHKGHLESSANFWSARTYGKTHQGQGKNNCQGTVRGTIFRVHTKPGNCQSAMNQSREASLTTLGIMS